MRLVVDANVLIAALMKDAAVRAALTTTADDLYTPEYASKEIRRHEDELRERLGASEEEFSRLLQMLFEHVAAVPRAEVLTELNDAARVMRDIDPDDAMFVATATVKSATVVSNDPDLHEQDFVDTMWVTEFVERAFGSNENGDEWN